MTILIKSGAGLLAGVFAGGLGYCFWPHAEPDVRAARASVEKPVFVVAAASSRPAPAPPPAAVAPVPAPVLAPPTDKSGLDKLAQALKSSAAANATRPAQPSHPVVTHPVPAQPVTAASPAPSPAAVASAPPPVAATPAASPVVVASAAAPAVSRAAPLAAVAPSSPPAPANGTTVLSREAPTPVAVSDDARSWSAQGLLALADGDLATSRLFLQRAADAGDSRALMALAETYNPATLARLGVVGAHGDPARARDYLARAVAAGVGAAKDRIAALEAQGN